MRDRTLSGVTLAARARCAPASHYRRLKAYTGCPYHWAVHAIRLRHPVILLLSSCCAFHLSLPFELGDHAAHDGDHGAGVGMVGDDVAWRLDVVEGEEQEDESDLGFVALVAVEELVDGFGEGVDLGRAVVGLGASCLRVMVRASAWCVMLPCHEPARIQAAPPGLGHGPGGFCTLAWPSRDRAASAGRARGRRRRLRSCCGSSRRCG